MFNRKKASRPLIDYRMTFKTVPGDFRVKSAVVVNSEAVMKRLPTKIFLYRELETPAPPKALQPVAAQAIPSNPITTIEKHPQKIEPLPIERPEKTTPSEMPEPALPPVDPTPMAETQVTAAQKLEPTTIAEAVPATVAAEEPATKLSKRKTQLEGAKFKVVLRFRPKVKLGRSDFIDAMDNVLSEKNLADLIESVNQSKKHVTVQLYATSEREAENAIQMFKDKVKSFAEANVSMQELYRQKANVSKPAPEPEKEPKVERPANNEKPIAVPKTGEKSFSLLDLQKENLSFEEIQCIYPIKEKPVSKETSQEEKLLEPENGVRKLKNNGDPDTQNPQ
jgi:hypothetical protein